MLHFSSNPLATVYANSLLVTLNSRQIVRGYNGQGQAPNISYTVPLSRISPRGTELEYTMDRTSTPNVEEIGEGQKASNGNYLTIDIIDCDLIRDLTTPSDRQ